jgi:hypothetical protein
MPMTGRRTSIVPSTVTSVTPAAEDSDSSTPVTISEKEGGEEGREESNRAFGPLSLSTRRALDFKLNPSFPVQDGQSLRDERRMVMLILRDYYIRTNCTRGEGPENRRKSM